MGTKLLPFGYGEQCHDKECDGITNAHRLRFLRFVPGSGRTGACDGSILSLLRNHHAGLTVATLVCIPTHHDRLPLSLSPVDAVPW